MPVVTLDRDSLKENGEEKKILVPELAEDEAEDDIKEEEEDDKNEDLKVMKCCGGFSDRIRYHRSHWFYIRIRIRYPAIFRF